MGFFDFIRGRRSNGAGQRRFLTEAAFRQNLAKQATMSPITLAKLRKHGVTEDQSRKLEFFFYADVESKARLLATALQRLRYDPQIDQSAADAKQFCITGWTTPMPMTEPAVVSWAEQTCHLGFEHDADFDGWGTYTS